MGKVGFCQGGCPCAEGPGEASLVLPHGGDGVRDMAGAELGVGTARRSCTRGPGSHLLLLSQGSHPHHPDVSHGPVTPCCIIPSLSVSCPHHSMSHGPSSQPHPESPLVNHVPCPHHSRSPSLGHIPYSGITPTTLLPPPPVTPRNQTTPQTPALASTPPPPPTWPPSHRSPPCPLASSPSCCPSLNLTQQHPPVPNPTSPGLHSINTSPGDTGVPKPCLSCIWSCSWPRSWPPAPCTHHHRHHPGTPWPWHPHRRPLLHPAQQPLLLLLHLP